MSTWMHLLVAPREARLLAREQFGALLRDLLRHEIVKMPCAVLSGDFLNADSSLGIANIFIHHHFINGKWVASPLDFPPGTELRGTGIIHYCGEDMEELLTVLSSVPYGTRDLCVWFEGLNFDNVEVRSTGNYNADVVVYALAKPQAVFYEIEEQEETAEDEERIEEDPDHGMEIYEKHTHEVQSCFRTIGSSGPYQTCVPMDSIFARYFGKDFIVNCSYS